MLGLSPYWEAVLTVAGINVIAAMGLYFTMLSGQLSAGHAAFPGIGAYAAGVLSAKFGAPIPVAWFAGAAVAFGIGAVLAFSFLPLSRWFLAIALFGINIAFVSVVESSDYLGGAQGFKGFELLTDFTLVWIFLIVMAVGLFFFTNSPWELTFRCVRDDPVAAEALGISPTTVRIVTLAVGASMSSFAGMLLAHWLTIVLPVNFAFTKSLDYIVFVAIGGRDVFLGPIVGALLLTVASEEFRFSQQFRLVLWGSMLTLVMLFMPGGLIGRWSTGSGPLRAVAQMFQPTIDLGVAAGRWVLATKDSALTRVTRRSNAKTQQKDMVSREEEKT